MRPNSAARSITCCKRWILDANVAIISLRPLFSLNIVRMERPTVASLIDEPGRSTLVLSHSNSSTPCLPISAMRCKSIILPSIGVKSILKSPVWNTVPTGVDMDSAHEPAIECETLTNSTLNVLPSDTTLPGCTTLSFALSIRISRSLFSISASVSRVP